MAELRVDSDRLRITLSVPERVLSLHGGDDIEVPLDSIAQVQVVRDVLSHLRGRRQSGAAGLPGTLAIGIWQGVDAGQAFDDFVLVHEQGSGVIVKTSGPFDRLVLSTDAPERLAFELTDRRQVKASCGRPPNE